MNAKQFLAELKSRGVYQAATLYAAAAWALLQVADVIFPIIGFADGAIELVLVLVSIGFPITILIAWLYDFTSAGVVETPESHPDAASVHISSARVIEFAVIGILVALVGYLYLDRLLLEGEPKPLPIEEIRPSIAVLPLVNMSDNTELEYFGDGLAEEILNLLARVESLDVAARTSSFYFKNKNADIRRIGDHLGVNHVLEGSVRYQDDNVRITVQLIESGSGFHLWSETYERKFDDTFSLQDEIALQVTEHLEVLLSQDDVSMLSRRPSIDPRAFDYYLRGRHYLRRLPDEESLSGAESMFMEALAIEPQYANALSGLCETYLMRYQNGMNVEDFENAEESCDEALSIDPEAFPVYVALGNLYRTSGDYEQSIDAFNSALARKSKAPDALTGLGLTQAAQGDISQADETINRAIKAQANYWPAHLALANLKLSTGDAAAAIVHYERINNLLPDNNIVGNNLGGAYFLFGRFADAVVTWERMIEDEASPAVLANIGSANFFLREFEEAEQAYSRASVLSPSDHEVFGFLADAQYYQNPESEKALANYQKAYGLASEALEINPANGMVKAMMAHYLAAMGRDEEARQYLKDAADLSPGDMYVYYYSATSYARLGDDEAALTSIKQAIEAGYFRHLLLADVGLDPIRESAQFQALIEPSLE